MAENLIITQYTISDHENEIFIVRFVQRDGSYLWGICWGGNELSKKVQWADGTFSPGWVGRLSASERDTREFRRNFRWKTPEKALKFWNEMDKEK